MRERLKAGLNRMLGKNISATSINPADVSNFNIKLQQVKILIAALLIGLLIIGSVALFIKSKAVSRTKEVIEHNSLTVELADKNLDPEKHWRNYFEEKQETLTKDLEYRLKEMTEANTELLNKTNQRIEQELADTKEKLDMAQKELASASLDLQRAAREGLTDRITDIYTGPELSEQDFDSGVEFDSPKSVVNYIPEGTYFTGHLLGGIAVSTGLNTPSENATPIAIKLMGRFDVRERLTTNLSSLNKTDLQNCRIMGSAYGDLSSERAIVRLEKMICENDGVYITSHIVGQIFGADGLNGIKGTVVATSSKHIKNAAIGGLISGVVGAAKGTDNATVTGAGLIQTKKKGAKNLLGEGVLQGAGNAGDKIADYYLRQAEAMSPILTVPSGVRINAQITKGFFVGEVSTHRKIKAARSVDTSSYSSASSNDGNIKSEYAE